MIDFNKEYYKLLEVAPFSSITTVKENYRKLAKRYHPDINPGNEEAVDRMKAINEAYGVLGNEYDKETYDTYLKSLEQHRKTDQPSNRRIYTKVVREDVTIKKFVKGELVVTYRGTLENDFSSVSLEFLYDINVLSVRAYVKESDIFMEEKLAVSFKQVLKDNKVFPLPIPQPIKTAVEYDNGKVGYYHLTLINLIVLNPFVGDITKHENENYGIIRGEFYGYFEQVEQIEKEQSYTECSGETGRTEDKEIAGIKYQRREYYNANCSKYWGAWMPQGNYKTSTAGGAQERKGDYVRFNYWYSDRKNTYWGDWFYFPKPAVSKNGCAGKSVWLSLILLFGALSIFFPPLWVVTLVILACFLLSLLSPSIWKWVYRTFAIAYFLFLLTMVGIAVLGKKSVSVPKDKSPNSTRSRTTYRPVPRAKTNGKLKDTYTADIDTLITQSLKWDDYNGRTYEGSYQLSLNLLRQSHNFKEQLANEGVENGYEYIVHELKENDKSKISNFYAMLSGLRATHALNDKEFAEMIVSCVQTLPYTLILPKSCNANQYADPYTVDYLRKKGARCDGFQKFGINSPLEFLGTLKGDCDTRALLLYTVLAHFNYDVIMLSSDQYSHSMIGINLDYEGTAYYYQDTAYVMWETTAQGIRPGIIPTEISNLNYWRISLKSKNNESN